jgi:tRNA threonylcarbamoyladenosine biosynthesis protein TsaB
MAYLALDTSTEALTLAVSDGTQLLGEVTTVRTYNHSVQLMPLLDHLLDTCGMGPSDLKGIVVGKGPGSYTGVRIGVTTAKVLAWTLKIPLLGVSTLQALAQTLQPHPGVILSLFDARRNRVYAGVYFHSVANEAVIPVAELGHWVCASLGSEHVEELPPVLATGDGSIVYQESLRQIFGSRLQGVAPMAAQHIRAAALLEIGIPKLRQGLADDVDAFVPEYLQLAHAEAKLAQQVKEGSESR